MAKAKASIPNLASYDPDGYWLVHLDPDYEHLHTYLYPSEARTDAAPAGAHTAPFSVSNIFSSPLNAPESQRLFDLAPVGTYVPNNLADFSGPELLHVVRGEDPIVPEGQDIVLTPLSNFGLTGFGGGKEWFDLAPVDPQTRRPVYNPALLQQLQERIDNHNGVVDWLCDVVSGHWKMALFRYHNARPAGQDWQPDPGHPLFLEPAPCPLPDQALISELADTRQTHHLLLLTARHELGYIYHKVEQWRKLPLHRRPPCCLSEWDLGLLTARSRSVPQWSNRRVKGSGGGHAFVTKLDYKHTSDLAERYHRIGHWARDMQMAVLEVGLCKQPGCTNPIRMTLRGGSTKGGAPSLYCEEHTTSRKNARELPP